MEEQEYMNTCMYIAHARYPKNTCLNMQEGTSLVPRLSVYRVRGLRTYVEDSGAGIGNEVVSIGAFAHFQKKVSPTLAVPSACSYTLRKP